MNALLPRTTQDAVNFLWEPFATSTPLKVVPNNAIIGDLLHKQLLTGSNNLTKRPLKRLSTSNSLQSKLADSKESISKKVKRNRSSAYLDFSSSSSSDEDSGDTKRRPIIKVGSKKTRSLLSVKKLENEQTETVSEAGVSACQKGQNAKTVKNTNNREKNPKPTATNWQGWNVRGKNGEKIGNANIDADVSSDEECKIFDESNTNKNTLNSTKHSLQTENIVNDKNVTKTKNETGKTKTCKTNLKTTHKNFNKMQTQKAAANNKTLLKRKCLNSAYKARAKKPLIRDKLLGKPVNVETPITPLRLWAHKSNLSHQLFSDSREQEFINTLDLTSEDINVSVEKITCPKTTPIKQIISANKNKDVCKNDRPKQERPIRRKQKPKEYWMPENTSPTGSVRSTVNKQTLSKRNITTSNSKCQTVTKQTEGDAVIEEIKENHESEKVTENVGPKGIEKIKRKKGHVLKEKMLNAPDDEEAVVTSTNEDELQRQEINNEMKQSGLCGDVKQNEVVGEKAVTTDKTVFQLFRQLPFKENELGCSVAQCQSINNFKCGVLKLKAKSEFKCKTLHSNSHLGGIVVKGLIRMKVGDKDQELNEGDMAFIPPLTEWQATNLSHSESVFYYWCGRFK